MNFSCYTRSRGNSISPFRTGGREGEANGADSLNVYIGNGTREWSQADTTGVSKSDGEIFLFFLNICISIDRAERYITTSSHTHNGPYSRVSFISLPFRY